MAKTDLILLHAPSIYDFRKRPILYGPVSDVVPSTQVFEMYPLGFMSLLGYLQRHGYSVRIINLALKMLRRRRFNAEKQIRSLKPAAFGLDLHWMVHAHGSLALATLIKKHHPETPVIFGGLSASYYHEELIRRPEVDFVIRGDSAEEPLRRLMQAIRHGTPFEEVPNLTWKNGARVQVNPISHVPADLDGVSFDYRDIMKSCLRHFDIIGHMPFKIWLRYPIVAALSCRGCIHNCAVCGGSAASYRQICGRSAPAYRSPGRLARDIGTISRYIKAPVIILGDILQAGEAYARELMAAMKREKVKAHIALEFFSPPSREFLETVADAVPNFNIQISPESHDERIRRAFGRNYGNAELERCIGDALELGCRRLDVFFMIGIPEQTPQSVRETIGYCRRLMERFRSQGRASQVHPYISPLAPFLDPGSRAFEDPEKHGYRLFHRTLEEHRQALAAPSWKHTLNYETKWMSRDELVDVTYEAALELNQIKLDHGLVRRKDAEKIGARITRERDLIGKIDAICRSGDETARQERLWEVMRRFDTIGPATICKKDEMNWPTGLLRFNPLRLILGALPRRRKG